MNEQKKQKGINLKAFGIGFGGLKVIEVSYNF